MHGAGCGGSRLQACTVAILPPPGPKTLDQSSDDTHTCNAYPVGRPGRSLSTFVPFSEFVESEYISLFCLLANQQSSWVIAACPAVCRRCSGQGHSRRLSSLNTEHGARHRATGLPLQARWDSHSSSSDCTASTMSSNARACQCGEFSRQAH
jgi:hypothetical protein